MKLEVSKDLIIINKELSVLDELVINFVSLIDFDYVIVSGYLPILFGRVRTTEDIDVIIKVDEKKFSGFCEKLKDYYFLNCSEKEAFSFLKDGLSVRIARKNSVFPNFELKLAKTRVHKYSLRNKKKVKLNSNVVNISPFEVQIAYKLFLGSDKDFEDARYLFDLFKNHLKIEELKYFIKELSIKNKVVKKVLGEF